MVYCQLYLNKAAGKKTECSFQVIQKTKNNEVITNIYRELGGTNSALASLYLSVLILFS